MYMYMYTCAHPQADTPRSYSEPAATHGEFGGGPIPQHTHEMYMYMYMINQSKANIYTQNSFLKKKLPWVGFEPTTLRVLGERSTS